MSVRVEIELPVWLALGAGAGTFLFFSGFRAWRRLRLIEDTPTSRVRSLPMGRVELQGRAVGKAVLAAPLTGAPCLYYRYRIEQEVRRNRGRSWRTLAQGDSSAWGFHLEDGTGRVLVDPSGAEVDVAHDWRETNPPLSRQLREALGQHGIDPHGLVFRKRLRFTEWRLAPGDPVYVLGVAQERPGLARERRRRIAEKLAAWKRDPDAMAHFDADGDGSVDAQEWQVARRLALEQVALEGEDDRVCVAADPHGDAPLYVSDHHEGRVLSRHRWRAFGGIWGGAALALGCGAGLLERLGLLGRF